MRHTSGTTGATAGGTPRDTPRGTGAPCAARAPARGDEPLDVVVLLASDRHGAYAQLFEAIVQVKLHDHTAVLVVFGHAVDDDTLRRAEAAGADFCVVAPASTDLFRHIERARTEHRSRPSTAPNAPRPPTAPTAPPDARRPLARS